MPPKFESPTPVSLLSSRFVCVTIYWTSAFGSPIINMPHMELSISCPLKPALPLTCLFSVTMSVFIHLLGPKTPES